MGHGDLILSSAASRIKQHGIKGASVAQKSLRSRQDFTVLGPALSVGKFYNLSSPGIDGTLWTALLLLDLHVPWPTNSQPLLSYRCPGQSIVGLNPSRLGDCSSPRRRRT